MTQVNYPYFIRKLRERAEFSSANNNYFDQLERILEQLYGFSTTDLVGGVDESSANENQIALLLGLVSDLSVAVADLASDTHGQLVPQEYRAVTVTTNYTALDKDFVNAKSGATITLPQFPNENATIIIRNGDGSRVRILGDSKKINNSYIVDITRQGTSLTIQYFIDSDEWLIR